MSFWSKLFMRYYHSAPGPTDTVIKPTVCGPLEVDDWVMKTGPWGEREACHCGQNRETWNGNPFYPGGITHNVCPKCGHKDKWEKFVCREAWEESPARQAYWEDRHKSGKMWEDWHRNERVERWTPEHCPVKD